MKPISDKQEIYSTAQLQELTGLSRPSILKLIELGIFTPLAETQKSFRFPRSQVDAWLVSKYTPYVAKKSVTK